MLLLSLMKLIGKEEFQEELWKQSGEDLLQRFPREIKQSYQFIFALGDWKSLLKLENEIVQEHVEFMQSCLIESMIQLSINEIMHPLQYITEVKTKGQIEIPSQCKLGTIHRISEIESTTSWELSRRSCNSKDDTPDDLLKVESLDEAIDSITAIESEWRKQRSIFSTE